jgi:hypothetical protein
VKRHRLYLGIAVGIVAVPAGPVLALYIATFVAVLTFTALEAA